MGELAGVGARVPVTPLANTRLIRPAQSVAAAYVPLGHVGQDRVYEEAPFVIVYGGIARERVAVAAGEDEAVFARSYDVQLGRVSFLRSGLVSEYRVRG